LLTNLIYPDLIQNDYAKGTKKTSSPNP
jgi:hypothetical protein